VEDFKIPDNVTEEERKVLKELLEEKRKRKINVYLCILLSIDLK
jgi:hypothetical protein